MPKIDEIRQRLEKITSGRWGCLLGRSDFQIFLGENDDTHICTVSPWAGKEARANVDFIANAPTDITFLLSEVERLRKENHALNCVAKAAKRIENDGSQDFYHLHCTLEDLRDATAPPGEETGG